MIQNIFWIFFCIYKQCANFYVAWLTYALYQMLSSWQRVTVISSVSSLCHYGGIYIWVTMLTMWSKKVQVITTSDDCRPNSLFLSSPASISPPSLTYCNIASAASFFASLFELPDPYTYHKDCRDVANLTAHANRPINHCCLKLVFESNSLLLSAIYPSQLQLVTFEIIQIHIFSNLY